MSTKRKPSSPQDFKKKKSGTFELPSGAVMKLRNPGGLQAVISSGMMPNSLMTIARKAVSKGQKMAPEDMVEEGQEMIDPKLIRDMTQLMDNVTVRCAVDPQVHAVPEKEEDRDDDLLYVDDLDDEDKMFIFQWVTGGTSDLEQFRKRHQTSLDSLGAVTEAEGDA